MKKPKPKTWSEAEQTELTRLVRKRTSTSEISKRLGRHAGSVRRMARQLGLLLKK